MIRRVIFLLILSSLFSEGKQLTKSEIKSIILSASKHKKYSRKPPKKTGKPKANKVAKASPKKTDRPGSKKVTKKIVPFELPRTISPQAVTLNQEGFVLIKGTKKTNREKKVNPLYRL